MKWVLVLLLLLPATFAVTIHGTVYDFSLDVVTDAIVEINSTPRQQMVSKDGTYSFTVPEGQYTLKAQQIKSDSDIEEEITAADEGDYVLDLILFPKFDEELLEEAPEVPDVEFLAEGKSPLSWLLWLLVFLALGLILNYMLKPPKKIIVEKEIIKEIREVALDEELMKVMDFIEKEGGRTTQKDIRRQFPQSEAKISLMLDELESKKLIKKVKKGRGNLILKT